MPFRWLFRNWLQQAAQEKIRDTVSQAAGGAAAGEASAAGPEQWACDVGLLFALEVESGGLQDLMHEVRTFRGHGFVVRRGQWRDRVLVLMHSGVGRAAAVRAAEALLLGHRPPRVIAAGFAGGLSPEVARHDLLLATSVADEQGNVVPLAPPFDPPSLGLPGRLHVGRLLTVDRVVADPDGKAALGRKHQALAVDMETIHAARACRERSVPLLAIRVITDAVGERLPSEAERLARQQTSVARLGAAVGAIWNRPGSLKDLWALQENALVAADRLAAAVTKLIGTG